MTVSSLEADVTSLPSIDFVMRRTHSLCCDSLQKVADVSIPYVNRLVPRAGHQVVAVYLELLNAADLLFVALQHLVVTDLLRRIPLLQLDSHIAATC